VNEIENEIEKCVKKCVSKKNPNIREGIINYRQ
jgi:hypothetical protein